MSYAEKHIAQCRQTFYKIEHYLGNSTIKQSLYFYQSMIKILFPQSVHFIYDCKIFGNFIIAL